MTGNADCSIALRANPVRSDIIGPSQSVASVPTGLALRRGGRLRRIRSRNKQMYAVGVRPDLDRGPMALRTPCVISNKNGILVASKMMYGKGSSHVWVVTTCEDMQVERALARVEHMLASLGENPGEAEIHAAIRAERANAK